VLTPLKLKYHRLKRGGVAQARSPDVALKLNYHRLKPVVLKKAKDSHDTLLKIGNIVRHRAGADGLAEVSISGVRV
jgi:hypothetical protein